MTCENLTYVLLLLQGIAMFGLWQSGRYHGKSRWYAGRHQGIEDVMALIEGSNEGLERPEMRKIVENLKAIKP